MSDVPEETEVDTTEDDEAAAAEHAEANKASQQYQDVVQPATAPEDEDE